MQNKNFELRFSELLSKFVLDMEQVPNDINHSDISVACAEMCRFLRISKLDCTLTEISKTSAQLPAFYSAVYFSEGEASDDEPLKISRDTSSGISIYNLYPHKNAQPWTEAEIEKINVFIAALFVFNSRAKSISMCNYLLFHDNDTGVYNIHYFVIRLNELIREGTASEYICCRLNLKKFTFINKTFKRNRGTQIMKRFAIGLQAISGEDCCLCRLGGDNFLHLFKADKAETVKNYLLGTSIETDMPAEKYVIVSARFSFFRITDDCTTHVEIIDKANNAYGIMKKDPQRNLKFSYIEYDEKIAELIENQRMVEQNFAKALKDEEFIVYYQPKIELRKYTLCGAEALCRWKRNGKLILPAKFIQVLEQSANICTLDFYMLEHVCQDIRRWLDMGITPVRVSVNISRVHLGMQNISKRIIDIVKKYDVPHKYIEIELTETTSDVDFSELKTIVSELHNVGISTSIDDFGIGYSSLNLIRDLQWNTLKIDKSFLPLKNEPFYTQKITMLKYVIAMARVWDLNVLWKALKLLNT